MKKIPAIPHFRQLCVITIGSWIFTMNAWADTTDVKTQTIVEVTKDGEHCEQDTHCFNRYHPAIQPVARANPGDLIVVHTRDALDSNLTIDSEPKDLLAIDLNLCLLYTSPSPRDRTRSRMPSSA